MGGFMGLRRLFMTALAIFLIIESANAGNLYKVTVRSSQEAVRLSVCRTLPVLRVSDGFLVLADDIQLAGSQLDYRLLSSDITREELYVDNSREEFYRPRFPIIYEEGDLRLIRAGGTALTAGDDNQVFPLPAYNISVEYKEPSSQKIKLDALGVPLDSLGELINKDSLESYLDRLQAFFRRLSGSDSDRAVRDWLHDKFAAFGYDSICYDSFPVNAGQGAATGENVLVYKIGAIAPEYQIIIGAHRDAAGHSPGADDDGSGMAAVMEMARILKDIPTQVTIIFALFDGEEQWLIGSTHYANEAKTSGRQDCFHV